MRLTFAAVIAVAVLVPPFAQAQQKATKATAQRVVNIIKADKAKFRAYCELGTLVEQIDEAERKKDDKRVDQLSDQMEALEKKLGPEYANFVEALNDMDANSKDTQEIDDTLSALDKMCGN
jgi:wobble nucleotide-excising tRNase